MSRKCVFFVTLVAILKSGHGMCPNLCNANGICNGNNLCTCFPGYTGPECNQRTCDFGSSWADKAYAVDAGHQLAECSNAGLCNRETGVCECYKGYTGQACEKATCPNNCYNRGECMTMADMASFYGQDYDPAVKTAGDGFGPTYSNWDKSAGTLCNCDWGYFGPDCSQTMCPKGDDPATDSQSYRQILLTVTDYPPFTGLLGVQFQGETTFMSLSAPNSSHCEAAFEASEKFDDITCAYSRNVDGDKMYFDLTFISWPKLPKENNLYSHNGNPRASEFTCDISRTDDNTVCTFTDVVNTFLREYDYCSNRGTCNFDTGSCKCDSGFEGLACERMNIITHTADSTVAEQITVRTPDFVSTAYLISAERSSHDDFYLLETLANSKQTSYIRGDGEVGAMQAQVRNSGLTVEKGGLTVDFGGLNVPTDGAYIYQNSTTSPALSVHSTSETFTGDALSISTVTTKTTTHNLINGYSVGSSTFRVRGDGLMNVHAGMLASGGFSVQNDGLKLSDGITIHSGGMKVTSGMTMVGATTVTGGVTINSAGLKVTGGMTSYDRVVVETGGVLVTAGGQTVGAGGLVIVDGVTVPLAGVTVTGSVSVHSSGVKVTGGMTISDLGLTITEGLTVQTAGMKVEGGGMSIYGGAKITGGLTVHDTGMTVTDGTTIVDTGLMVELVGMTVDSWGLHVTSGLTVNTAGLFVNTGGAGITGGVSVQDTGMKVTTGLTVNNGGVVVTAGGATVAVGGLRSTGGLTVTSNRLNVEASGIRATGGLTVYDTGLAVSGGATVVTSGFVVTTGGGTIRAGSMKVVGGLTASTGGVVVEAGGVSSTGGLTINSGGMSVTGGLTVTTSGLIVTANGATIAGNGMKIVGGVSIQNTGITVTGTGMKVTGGLTTNNVGVKVTGGVTVDTGGVFVSATGATVAGGLTAAGGVTLGSGAVKVDASGIKITGGLSLNNNGLSVPAGQGVTVVDTGLVVTNTGLTVSATGMDLEGMSVVTGGLNVDAAGIKVTGGLTVNSGATAYGAGTGLTINDVGVNVVGGGFSVIGGLKVGAGLTVGSGNVIISSHVRSSGGISVYTGGGVTGGLTVRNTGLKVDTGGATFTGHLHVSGIMTVGGDIYCATNTPSDRRLKTNIDPLTNTLSEITKLRGVYFKWNENSPAFNSSKTKDRRQLGLIAQDVQSVYPELVYDIMDGDYMGVNYVSMIPVLIEAVRELNDKYLDLDVYSQQLDRSTQGCG